MAFGLGLFGSLSGMKTEAINAAIVGTSALAGLAAAKFVTDTAQQYLPDAVKPYAGVLPFIASLATAMYVRRFDSRVAVGAAAGMAMYGLWHVGGAIPGVKDLVGKASPYVGLSGAGGMGEVDLSIRRYLNGASITAESLQGAPTSIESLRGGMSRRAAATIQ